MLLQTTGEKTDLPTSISGLAWGDAFIIGHGVDAITGAVSASPLKPFEVQEVDTATTRIRELMISDESEYSQEIDVGAKGSFNINGVTAEGSASYLTRVRYSSTSLTVLAQVNIDEAEYRTIKSPALTAAANELLNSNQEKFKSTYGEYFLYGVKKGSTLTVILSCTSKSTSELRDFKSSFSVSKADLFTAEGYAKFKSEASAKNISITFDVTAVGYKGTVPSDQSPEVLKNWFIKNASGVAKFAYLSSYSDLNPNFSREVDIEPVVFARVQALYQKSWVLTDRYSTCPSNYKSAFADRYNLLINEINVSKSSLTRTPQKIGELDQRANDLLAAIGEIFNRLDLYRAMQGLAKTEPRQNDEIPSGAGQIFLYGINEWRAPGIAITTRSDRYSDSWHIGWREKTFDFSSDSNALVIGWMMINNWRDDTNGVFWKATDQIIGTSSAKVHVKSYYDRGTDWSINVYQVNKSLYNFGNT
jgi:hypothetical protein